MRMDLCLSWVFNINVDFGKIIGWLVVLVLIAWAIWVRYDSKKTGGSINTLKQDLSDTPRNELQRKEILQKYIAQRVAAGSKVEYSSDFRATTVMGGNTNHILHLLLCIPTLGLWVFIWILIGLSNRRSATIISVDEFGNIHLKRS